VQDLGGDREDQLGRGAKEFAEAVRGGASVARGAAVGMWRRVVSKGGNPMREMRRGKERKRFADPVRWQFH
jgi:hypothetical protein